jgi:hypothetical protein
MAITNLRFFSHPGCGCSHIATHHDTSVIRPLAPTAHPALDTMSYRVQHRNYRPLDDLVLQRRDRKRPLSEMSEERYAES